MTSSTQVDPLHLSGAVSSLCSLQRAILSAAIGGIADHARAHCTLEAVAEAVLGVVLGLFSSVPTCWAVGTCWDAILFQIGLHMQFSFMQSFMAERTIWGELLILCLLQFCLWTFVDVHRGLSSW